jgi:RNA-directed DNA polymerase
VTPIDQVLDEGNCGEATNRGEEACACAVKLTLDRRRQPHSRQSCKVTDRNPIQGRCGQASEPNITKPSSFLRIGKSGACAAKAIRLILGDPPHVSAIPTLSAGRAIIGNDAGVQRKSAEVIVLLRRIPATTGRTDLNRYVRGWIGYFGLAQQFDLFDRLDGWIRRRIRMCYWKQWRRPRTKIRNLVRLGVPLKMAILHAISRKSYWRLSRTPATRIAMPNKWLTNLGLLSLKQLWCDLAPLRGTA